MKYLLCMALLMPAPQDPTQKWAVRFSIETRPTAEVPDPPMCHISVLVKAPTEGQATVTALQFVQRLVSIDANDRMKFVDACKKE